MAVVEQVALHFKAGGSDKVWAGAFTDSGDFLSAWGRRGACKEGPVKNLGSVAAAEKLFNKKKDEKLGEGYRVVTFDHPDYGIASFGGAVSPMPEVAIGTTVGGYYTSHVMPLGLAIGEILDGNHGICEKANGSRCVLVKEGEHMSAYNRRGKKSGQIPLGAQKLSSLSDDFAIDGERMEGDMQGSYIAFDLLELNGRDLRNLPYEERMNLLLEHMQKAGMVSKEDISSQVIPRSNSLQLVRCETSPDKAHALAARIRESGGEGIIVRTLNAPYQVGDSLGVRKLKYVADVDCIITGINPGMGGGSLELSLYDNGNLVNVGNVRAGLNENDIRVVADMLNKGKTPVITVTYLPARTVGTKLVEPKANLGNLRDDKTPQECTIDQINSRNVGVEV